MATVSLFKIDSKTGSHINVSYNQTDQNDIVPFRFNNKSLVTYDSRKGFLLSSITEDRFICKANLPVNAWNGDNVKEKSIDQNIIIQYTSNGSDYIHLINF